MDLNFEIIRNEFKDSVKLALQKKNIGIIESKLKSYNRTETDLKCPLDQVFRDMLLELVEKEADVKVLQELLTLSTESCRKGLSSLSIPVILLADIFDLLTLDSCETMFAYVEQHVNVWKEELFFTSCKNNLLRLCNDLLRRLSRSSATVFCGRILLFLAKFFPFSERSGLNIVSEFNLENVTEYGSENIEDIVKEKDKDEKNKGVYIDYSLYCKFWSLQDFFRNPNQCYNKVQWKLFCLHANNIISTFQGLKLEHIDKENSWILPESTHEVTGDKTTYFSKYLTNQKLLDLQLYDVNFRRFVLLQFLILFQYLTTTVRFKTDNYDLKNDQKDWITALSEKVYALLKETPPDGERFATIVSNILNREEYWNSWKNDGCPEFRKTLPPTEVDKKTSDSSKAPFLGDIIKEAQKNGSYYLGDSELTKLWNLSPSNLEACKAKDRDFLPSLDSYFSEAIGQLDNADAGSDTLLKDGNFGWRALRLLARRSPHFFTHSNKPISELYGYLEMMVRRIAADKPGIIVDTEQNDAEIEEDLFKQPDEAAEDMKNNDGDDIDENYIRFKVTLLTMSQFDNFCEKLAVDWKVLAVKLGFKSDAISYIVEKNPDKEVDQARSLLHLWFEDDDDSTLENFLYILEGLQLNEAAEEVKVAIEQNKMLIISDLN